METNMKLTALLPALLLATTTVLGQGAPEIKKAIDAEQWQKAKGLAKALVTAKPSSGEGYAFLGNIYLESGYPDSAKTVFEKGIAAESSYALNYVGLGAVKLETNNAAAATADFDKAISLTNKKDPQTFLQIGKAYTAAAKPDYTRALSYQQQAKLIDPKNAEVYLALGETYQLSKKQNDAYDNYNKAIELDPALLRAKVDLGVLLKNSRAFKESAEQFNKILATDPNYAPAYRELAENYYLWANIEPKTYDANIKQALTYYRKYVDLTDRSVESRMRYADFLILAKDYKTLEQEAQAMAQMEKSNKRILRYLGYSAYENGNFPASADALTNFIAKVETDRVIPRDYLYLGKAQLKTGKSSDAVTNIEKAVAMDSTVAGDLEEAAKALFTAKNYEDAARLYELTLKNPNSKSVAYNNFYMGMAYYFNYAAKVKGGKDSTNTAMMTENAAILVKADSAFSKVIALSPASPDAYLYRARVKRLLDDEKNPQGLMIPDYEKYVELVTAKPDFATNDRVKTTAIEAYSYLGAYSAKTDKEEAKDYFKKIIQLDPQNDYAVNSLKSLN
ncbi:tetratricopeptide repeat protein [Hufsiella ginkgonis]|uniref:Tetratricopeptide repeat protein n=1 Tax=Hufsiella ginkgonis TaxID=2695274 RepID=A0A7K1Y0Y4_9SPHI|nr:tetratricopeptide repeat protein [Hufsiella ginkgonis]MXV16910.1 hypothetical protein [Hufsiella ginkgonis]